MNHETTIENVKAQLMFEWEEDFNDEGDSVDIKGKQLMTEQEAVALIQKHKTVFDHCKLMRSFAYYTANQILTAEGK